jgi:hypothetical protein
MRCNQSLTCFTSCQVLAGFGEKLPRPLALLSLGLAFDQAIDLLDAQMVFWFQLDYSPLQRFC